MSSPVETTVAKDIGSISLQVKPTDEDWQEENDSELDSYITENQKIIPAIVSDIRSDDRRTRLIATIKIRRLLQRRPPEVAVQPVINSGLVPAVVEMLSINDNKFRAEAAWIVTNLSCGTSEQTATVVEAGAIPKLVAMFPTDVTDVQLNALWALGNIGGDSERFRDMVAQAGGIQPPLDVLDAPEMYTEKVRNTASRLVLCYLNPHYAKLGLDVTSTIIPILAKFLRGAPKNVSHNTLDYAVKALDQICANEAAAELIITTGILPRLVELCNTGNTDLSYNAIHCVGRFTAGSEASTDAAIEAGFLEALKPCIFHNTVTIRETACWAVSNVAAGSLSQVHALLKAGLLPILVRVVSDKQEVQKPRNEATWALANLVDTAMVHPELVDPLIEGDCVEAFSDAIGTYHSNTQRLAVQSLQKLLSRESRNQDRILELLKAADGIARLRALRDEKGTSGYRSEVRTTAHEILKEHYPDFARRARV
ncbi:Importin subunit alpha-4 [Tulasnella sp. 408]|nr:Importin subunit alpha-4 [Tulasnella sp. 408]